jgi:hypothetical protein
MIGQALVQYLAADSEVSALVSNRIFPHVIPQQVPGGASRVPCLVYRIAAEERDRTLCETQRLFRARIEISSYARTFATARALAAAVREALVDYAGTMGSPAVRVRDVALETAFTLDDMEPGLFREQQNYALWLEE